MDAHPLDRLPARQSAEFTGALKDAVAGEGFVHLVRAGQLALLRSDNRHDLDPVLAAELEIALVVRRYRHDRPCAVGHDHEVPDPDRKPLSAVGVDRVATDEEALLLQVVGALGRGGRCHPLAAFGKSGLSNQRMQRRQNQTGGPEDRVDAGGEDTDGLVGALHREIDLRAGRATDPVALHGQDAVGPAGLQLVKGSQKLVRIGSGPEEPLLTFLLFDGSLLVTPAAAAHDLLVGQNRGAGGAPVHRGLLAIGQAPFPHPEEEPLVPPVVFRLAARQLAVPVVAEAERVQLPPHRVDVRPCPLARVTPVLDRCVLGREAEGVPSHRVEDAKALHPLVPGKRIADRVVADVAHVQHAGRVRKHLEDVVLGLSGVRRGPEDTLVGPVLLPLRLDFAWPVRVRRHAFRVATFGLATAKRSGGIRAL